MSRYPKYATVETVKERTNYRYFDSPEAYAQYLDTEARPFEFSRDYSRYDSFSGGDLDDAVYQLQNGTDKHIERAQELIDEMSQERVFSPHLPVIASSVVGFAPNVAAAVMGLPLDMYSYATSEDESPVSPIRIYIETLVSGGVSHDQLIARGIACMAFALAMNNIRPVELYTICIGQPDSVITSGAVVKVPTKPLDLRRAALMLCDPIYYRQAAFTCMKHLSNSHNEWIHWPWENEPRQSNHEPLMRTLLDMQPEDVFIPGGYLLDSKMLNEPIQWVKDMIKKHTGTANLDC